jgi:hypothetical protein
MKTTVSDRHGDVLYNGPLPKEGPRTGTHPLVSEKRRMRECHRMADLRLEESNRRALEFIERAEPSSPPAAMKPGESSHMELDYFGFDLLSVAAELGHMALFCVAALASFVAGMAVGRLP